MASAQSGHTPASEGGGRIVVRFSELDLTREQGARVLIGRIERAARLVCGPEPSQLSLSEHQAFRGCVTQATFRSVRRVDAPLVTAIYRSDAQRLLLAQR
jgi:UrcA family protein